MPLGFLFDHNVDRAIADLGILAEAGEPADLAGRVVFLPL